MQYGMQIKTQYLEELSQRMSGERVCCLDYSGRTMKPYHEYHKEDTQYFFPYSQLNSF